MERKYITLKELETFKEDLKRQWKVLLAIFIISRGIAAEAVPEMPLKEIPKPEPVSLFPKILIIDDDPASFSSIAAALNQGGIEVVTASNCSQGLLKLDEIHPDLVLLSEMLPGSGDACSKIREKADIPIILLGSDPSEEAWDRAVALGADAYLRKSIGKAELAARAKALLRRYHQVSPETLDFSEEELKSE